MSPEKMLIVDDQPSILFFLQRSLERHWPACLVDTADSIFLARSLIRSKRYDLILTDFSLRDGDGFQIARLARRAHPPVPVVLMTASQDALAYAQSSPGAYSISSAIAKPFELSQLYSALGSAIGSETETEASI